MTIEQILQIEMDAIAKDLLELHKSKGMVASGDWVKSVSTEATPFSGSVFAEDYTEYLEDGRKAGGFPPIDKIKKWINDKGIVPNDITINSLAFLIARKISKEGWNRSEHGGVNLVSEIITPQRVQAIVDRVGTQTMLALVLKIEQTFKVT